MNLNQELQLRTRHLVPADVLRAMGYSLPEASAVAHYQAIGESPYLGLEREYRDERFGERGFLEALCRCAGSGMSASAPTPRDRQPSMQKIRHTGIAVDIGH